MNASEPKKTKKEEYIDKLSAQLKEWSAQIDELESRTVTVAADVRASYTQRVDDLKARRDALSIRLRELKESSEEAWETLKSGLDTSWEDLKGAVIAAKERIKGKKAA